MNCHLNQQLFQACFRHVLLNRCHIKSSYLIKRFGRGFHSSHQSCSFWNTSPSNKGRGETKSFTLSKPHDGTCLLERYIFVKTLVNYFEDVPDGIILDTCYADSRPNEDFNPVVPVVMGLHDTPGSHTDLMPILNVFAKLGCRTIAPTFPGHGNTIGLMSGFDDVFSHSTTERAAFVHDFLGDLGIERVDLLIGVGAACYPTLRLCTGPDTSDIYRSMALISPWPLQRPRYEADPDVIKRIQYLWDHPFIRPSVKLFLPSLNFANTLTTRDKITAAYLLGNLDLGEAGGLAMAAGTMNHPRVVIFGEMDADVEPELYYDVIDSLDIPRANVSVFEGKYEVPHFPGALVFPQGGYDLHRQHSGIISAYLLNILQLFHPFIRI